MYHLKSSLNILMLFFLISGCHPNANNFEMKDLGFDSDGINLFAELLVNNHRIDQIYLSYGHWGQNNPAKVLISEPNKGDTIRFTFPTPEDLLGNLIEYHWIVHRNENTYETPRTTWRIHPLGVIPPLTTLETKMLFKNNVVVDGLLSLTYHKDSLTLKTNDPGERGITVYEDFNYAQMIDTVKNNAAINMITSTISSSHNTLKRYVKKIDDAENALLVRTSYDIEKAYQEDKLAIMYYSQKHYPIKNNPDSIKGFYNSGLRVYQLVYGASDLKNHGPEERLGAAGLDVSETRRRRYNAPYDDLGLTPLGERVVKKLNELNMIIDCSHCSEETIFDAIAISTTPVITNHVNTEAMMFDDPKFTEIYGVNPKYRGLSDSGIVAVAKNGGIIGPMPVNVYLDTDGNGPDLNDLVVHINHMVDVIDNANLPTMGVDHITLASDGSINGWPHRSRFYPGKALSKTSKWQLLIQKLSESRDSTGAMRYSTDDLKQIIGGNAVRFYQSVLEGHSPPRLVDVSIKNKELNFKWKASKVIKVEKPIYELQILGQDQNNEYNVIYEKTGIASVQASLNIEDILDEDGKVFKNYLWFVKAINSKTTVNSAKHFFNLNQDYSELMN